MSCECFALAYDDKSLEGFKSVFHKYEVDSWDYLPLVLDHISQYWKMTEKEIIDSEHLCSVDDVLSEPFHLMFYEHEWKKKEELRFQERFEDYCRTLRIDVSKVQSSFDELVSMTGNPKYMTNYGGKENYSTVEYKNKADELAARLKTNIGWKHVVGLSYLDYDNFDIEEYEPRIRCVLEEMSEEEHGDNGFVVVQGCYLLDSQGQQE